jgi:hypothetical protein
MSPTLAKRLRKPTGFRIINRELLEAGAYALKANAELLKMSLRDLGCPAKSLDEVLAAITNVVERDFRSPETPGGS